VEGTAGALPNRNSSQDWPQGRLLLLLLREPQAAGLYTVIDRLSTNDEARRL